MMSEALYARTHTLFMFAYRFSRIALTPTYYYKFNGKF